VSEDSDTDQLSSVLDPITDNGWDHVQACASYADGLHTLCLSMLRDHDAAAEALHTTFVIAQTHIGRFETAQPDRTDSPRAWLYVVARNECLRRLDSRRRRVAAISPSAEWPASWVNDEAVVGLERNLRLAELQCLVWLGSQALAQAECEVLELSIRHGLGLDEVAVVLGTSPEIAGDLLRRAHAELRRSLAAVTLARDETRHCEQLAALVGPGWNGQLNPVLCSRLLRHIDHCPVCRVRLDTISIPQPPGLLPQVPAPRALRRRIVEEMGASQFASRYAKLARRVGEFGADGFPVRYDRKPSTFRVWHALAAAALICVVVAGVLYPQLRVTPAAPFRAGSDRGARVDDDPGLGSILPSPISRLPKVIPNVPTSTERSDSAAEPKAPIAPNPSKPAPSPPREYPPLPLPPPPFPPLPLPTPPNSPPAPPPAPDPPDPEPEPPPEEEPPPPEPDPDGEPDGDSDGGAAEDPPVSETPETVPVE